MAKAVAASQERRDLVFTEAVATTKVGVVQIESPHARTYAAQEGVARQGQSHHLEEAKVRDEVVAHRVEDAVDPRSTPRRHVQEDGAVDAARREVDARGALAGPARLECSRAKVHRASFMQGGVADAGRDVALVHRNVDAALAFVAKVDAYLRLVEADIASPPKPPPRGPPKVLEFRRHHQMRRFGLEALRASRVACDIWP